MLSVDQKCVCGVKMVLQSVIRYAFIGIIMQLHWARMLDVLLEMLLQQMDKIGLAAGTIYIGLEG